MELPWQQSYTALPPRCFAWQTPSPVPAPRWLAWNADLAQTLGLEALHSEAGLALLAGNGQTPGLAMAYAGHQFGGFVPQLGDGRALLLGDVAWQGSRAEVQLKGAGRTVFSRGGDGRAAMGPVLREYVMSEAMHALGVPTTRALTAVATGARIQRETAQPGAVLTRVAHSHLRVGTFEYFAARNDREALDALLAFALARHAPQAEGAPGLLRAVVAAQARLIAHWMSLGFIHGVMNTDNCAISGQTIDYGPAAMMDAYDPAQVFSKIDRNGRYAFGNQPKIALWNLTQLANALLPLMPDTEASVSEFSAILDGFAPAFERHWQAMFSAKLGLRQAPVPLIQELLALLAQHRLDFTQSFADLNAPPELADWRRAWRALSPNPELAARHNPTVVPRLHLIAAAISAAEADDMAPFQALLAACITPFAARRPDDPLTLPPRPEQRVPFTTCGT